MFFALIFDMQLLVVKDWLSMTDCIKLDIAVSNNADKSALHDVFNYLLADIYTTLELAFGKKARLCASKRKLILHIDLTLPGEPVTFYKEYLQEVVDLQDDNISELTDDWSAKTKGNKKVKRSAKTKGNKKLKRGK